MDIDINLGMFWEYAGPIVIMIISMIITAIICLIMLSFMPRGIMRDISRGLSMFIVAMVGIISVYVASSMWAY
ncbi:hypothetical protein [Chengkuizengella axinellae]|uniref:DUF2768 domain-containing protein n=1 Tax=Chengkuizengella axinellae TaxID=3064388 RepID=A0ABT9IV49_9BACL|nr:hypothetical protein [Chengkuizengella sp. 2205SS18-9]MDP5273213.1 hypothetical protein [Chengkuizengella sp. 2205SS18-9]